MTASSDILRLLWGENDPYLNFPFRRFRVDTQGWNSDHLYLGETITTRKPSVIVEVGVWKGGSVIHMAEKVKELGFATTIVAVDTWLGSAEHWNNQEWREELFAQNGYPSLYYTFLTNVMERELSNIVVPVPLDSHNAAVVLEQKRIFPAMIHLDAGHDYRSLTNDLQLWWNLLAPGGVLIADDYDETGQIWPEVRRAVRDFLDATPHESFEALPFKCRFVKPLESAI